MEHLKDTNVKKYFMCLLEFLLENDIINKWKSFVLVCIFVYCSVKQKLRISALYKEVQCSL